MPADPLLHVLVVPRVRILKGFEHIVVAPDSSAVLRRTPPPAADAGGQPDGGVVGEDLLQRDLVLPVVAEVVHVCHPVLFALQELADPVFPLVEVPGRCRHPEVAVPRTGDAEALVTLAEHVEMAVLPPHDHLDEMVQGVEVHRRRNEDAAPDRWLGSPQDDSELVGDSWGHDGGWGRGVLAGPGRRKLFGAEAGVQQRIGGWRPGRSACPAAYRSVCPTQGLAMHSTNGPCPMPRQMVPILPWKLP